MVACRESGASGGGLEGLLEGVCALRAEGLPGECYGFGESIPFSLIYYDCHVSCQLLTLSRLHLKALCGHCLDEPDRLRPQIPCAY